MENQIPVAPIVTPQIVVEQPKQSNFLVILLSILLFASVLIAGFFAFQTQKLVKELTLLRTEPTPSATSESVVSPELTFEQDKTLDPTANWKTYTNAKYNFSFKYPTDKFKNQIINEGAVYLDTYANSGGSPMGLGENDLWFNVGISTASNTDKEITKKFVQTNSSQNVSSYEVQKIVNGVVYKIGLYSFVPKTVMNSEALFDQILSTFKFTN